MSALREAELLSLSCVALAMLEHEENDNLVKKNTGLKLHPGKIDDMNRKRNTF